MCEVLSPSPLVSGDFFVFANNSVQPACALLATGVGYLFLKINKTIRQCYFVACSWVDEEFACLFHVLSVWFRADVYSPYQAEM